MDKKMKTDCGVKDLMSPLMDGELSARKERSVRRHLAGCAVCRKEYEAFQCVDHLLREVKPIAPSDAFSRNFWEQADAVAPGKLRWPGFADFSLGWRPSLAAAAAALLVITAGAGIVYRSAQTTVDPTTMLIAEKMALYRDYEIINHLELFEHWDEIVWQTE